MHGAVASHPTYRSLAEQVAGQPEARVLQAIAEQYFGLKVNAENTELGATAILVEDKSTNCGANASRTREVLQSRGITEPRTIIVAQDPTMCRRTVASFEHVYSDKVDARPELYSWPILVPSVLLRPEAANLLAHPGHRTLAELLRYDVAKMRVSESELWGMSRFLDLIMGEIPRLRDDSGGYGPKGKGFIAHVDIPREVEAAWETLDDTLGEHVARR